MGEEFGAPVLVGPWTDRRGKRHDDDSVWVGRGWATGDGPEVEVLFDHLCPRTGARLVSPVPAEAVAPDPAPTGERLDRVARMGEHWADWLNHIRQRTGA